MANRFAGPISRGEISSIEELKTLFKTFAKASHPDLAGPGSSGEDFAALRAEYEAALRDFVYFRFGLSAGRGEGTRGAEAAARASRPARGIVFDRGLFYEALRALRGRGFPKCPRHDQERRRYEYRRFVFLALLSAWSEGYAPLFESFEASLLDAESARESGGGGEALQALDEILRYHAEGGEHLKRSIELDFGRLSSGRLPSIEGDGRSGPPEAVEAEGFLPFLALLVGDMGGGPARRAPRRRS